MYLDYAGVRVRHLDRALTFYTEALGLLELRRGTMEHGGVWVLLEDRVSRQRLELNWYPEGTKYATPYAAGEELDHLGIRSADPERTVRELVAAGAREVDRIVEDGQLVAAFLADPDGITLEVIPTAPI
jgi:catechol 2,3-dioxygenase-like lactoylglutathione lyase family enzyme